MSLPSEGTRLLLALGVALGGGVAIGATGDERLIQLAESVAPVGTLWVNAIQMTVIPLVVALLVTGVAGASDLRAIGRLGGRTLAAFALLLAGVAVVIMPIAVAVFALLPSPAVQPPLPPGAAEAASQLAGDQGAVGFADWLLSLVPTNPVSAAANGEMVSLIVFTVLFALAAARSPASSREVLLSFFRALGDAMLVLVRWVIALAPIGIVGLVLPLAARTGPGLVGGVGFYVLVYSVLSLVTALLLYPVAAVSGRIPIGRFARAALTAQSIAFSSASSLASLPALVESAEELSLPPRVTGFVLPLAVSTFKIAAPVSWTVGALFAAWFYGVDLGPLQLATIALAAVFLAFAAPGVPRGAFLMLAPLFVAIGLPVEGIGVLIAVDAIPDMFATVLNVTGDLTAAVLVDRTVPRDEGPSGP